MQPLDTTVVAPLVSDARRTLTVLEISVTFGDETLVVALPELAAVPSNLLQRPVGSLAKHEDAIRRALDRIFTGF